MTAAADDDARVRAMVALLEAQEAEIERLRQLADALEGRLTLKGALDVIVADEVFQSVADLRMGLQALRRLPVTGTADGWLVGATSERADFLAARLNDLLAPAPVETPRPERTEIEPVELDELVRRAAAAATPVDPAQVRVSPASDGMEVSTVLGRAVAVLAVLLDNAARHGGPGPIDVVGSVEGDDVVLTVRDHGPGFGPNAARLLGSVRDRRGVGLAVARALVEAMGGRLQLADHPEGGAVATLRLPQRRADEQAPPFEFDGDRATSPAGPPSADRTPWGW